VCNVLRVGGGGANKRVPCFVSRSASALPCSRHEIQKKPRKEGEEGDDDDDDDDDDDEEETRGGYLSAPLRKRGENRRGGMGLRVGIALPCPAATCAESAFLAGYFSSFLPSFLPSFLSSFLPLVLPFFLQRVFLLFIIDSLFARPYSVFFYFAPSTASF